MDYSLEFNTYGFWEIKVRPKYSALPIKGYLKRLCAWLGEKDRLGIGDRNKRPWGSCCARENNHRSVHNGSGLRIRRNKSCIFFLDVEAFPAPFLAHLHLSGHCQRRKKRGGDSVLESADGNTNTRSKLRIFPGGVPCGVRSLKLHRQESGRGWKSRISGSISHSDPGRVDGRRRRCRTHKHNHTPGGCLANELRPRPMLAHGD